MKRKAKRTDGDNRKRSVKTNGTCKTTGKIRFHRKRDAVTFASRKPGGPGYAHRSYRCEFCGDFHLTKKVRRKNG